jgi:predicted enzyme related to lactoylglutathione lyase
VVTITAVDTMLCVGDLARSVAFYRDTLGFDVAWERETIAALELAGHRVYLFTESPPTKDKPETWLRPQAQPGHGSVILVLRTDDCEATYDTVRERGGAFLTPPATPPWGGRRCFLLDPDGYVVEIEQSPA